MEPELESKFNNFGSATLRVNQSFLVKEHHLDPRMFNKPDIRAKNIKKKKTDGSRSGFLSPDPDRRKNPDPSRSGSIKIRIHPDSDPKHCCILTASLCCNLSQIDQRKISNLPVSSDESRELRNQSRSYGQSQDSRSTSRLKVSECCGVIRTGLNSRGLDICRRDLCCFGVFPANRQQFRVIQYNEYILVRIIAVPLHFHSELRTRLKFISWRIRLCGSCLLNWTRIQIQILNYLAS